MFKQKGQSTVEYLLLFTCVIAVIIVALTNNGHFKKTIMDVFTSGINCLDSATTKFKKG